MLGIISKEEVSQELQQAAVYQNTVVAVTDPGSLEIAGGIRQSALQFIKNVDTKFDPIETPLAEALKHVRSLKKETIAPTESVEKDLNAKIEKYQAE